MPPFEKIDYTRETFKGLSCEGDVLKAHSFANCTFEACRFSSVDFSGSDFSECVFDRCELSLVRLTDVALKEVAFKDSKLVGVDFTKIQPSLLRMSFENCLIDTCNFSSLKLKQIPFLRCTIRESRFLETTLTEADFDGSDLEHSLFHQCHLEKANFVRARNYAIDPTTNKLAGAIFSLPEAIALLTGLGVVLK